MNKTTAALITAAAALPLLAACGTAASPASAPAPARQVNAAPAGPQGFQVPSALQSSLKRQINARARKEDYGFSVRSVTCVEQGRQAATCLAGLSDDSSVTLHVVISADGDTYVSH